MVASMSGSIANKGESFFFTCWPYFRLGASHGMLTRTGLTCLAYNTSKSALLQMCRSAAAEWGAYGIRVNVSEADVCYQRYC